MNRPHGFGQLCCPRCNEVEATISVDLDDLNRFHCNDCNEDFERSDVEAHIEMLRAIPGKWDTALVWIDTAPPLPTT